MTDPRTLLLTARGHVVAAEILAQDAAALLASVGQDGRRSGPARQAAMARHDALLAQAERLEWQARSLEAQAGAEPGTVIAPWN